MNIRQFFSFILLVAFTATGYGQQKEQLPAIAGDWGGTLHVMGTELPIIFHIRADAGGSLSATLDCP